MSPLELSCINTALEAVSEASVMRVKGLEISGKARTSCLVNMVCRLQKACFWSGLQVQGFDCSVRSRRGQAMLEKKGMNF